MDDITSDHGADLLNKVPAVTLIFWIIKIMSTTVGETAADYLAVHVGLGTTVTSGVMVVLLITSLLLQLRTRCYVPWTYWLTVVLVSIVGTQITDALTDGLGVSLYASTAAFAAALAVAFAIWYGVERTLSIQTIITRRRELFYWHSRGRPRHGSPWSRLQSRPYRVWGAYWDDRDGALLRRQWGPDLLACLHSD